MSLQAIALRTSVTYLLSKRISAAQCEASDLFDRVRPRPSPITQIEEDKEHCEETDVEDRRPKEHTFSRRRMSHRTNSERLEQLTKEVDMLLSHEFGDLDRQDEESEQDTQTRDITGPTTDLVDSKHNFMDVALEFETHSTSRNKHAETPDVGRAVPIVKDVALRPPAAPFQLEKHRESTDTTTSPSAAKGYHSKASSAGESSRPEPKRCLVESTKGLEDADIVEFQKLHTRIRQLEKEVDSLRKENAALKQELGKRDQPEEAMKH